MTQKRSAANLLRLEKVLGVRKEHFLNARIEYDGGYGALMAGVGPAPAAVRISKINLYAMYSFGLILLLCLQNELFEDGVVASNDAEKMTRISPRNVPYEPRALMSYLIDNTSQLLPSGFLPLLTLSQCPL